MQRLVVIFVYSLLALTGLLGNIWVISTVLDQFFANRRPKLCSNSSPRPVPRKMKPAQASAYLYLLLLSTVDLISLAAVPLLVVDVAQSQWPFGSLACKLLFTFEGANKSLTPLVLMALSVDRYVAVCRSSRHRLREWSYAAGISACCIGISLLFILPVALEASVTPLWDSNEREHVKCTVAMPIAYDLLQSLVCYILPLLAICYVYAAILWRLYQHKEGLGKSARSRISLATVVKCSVMVVAFYFVCWTPYWALRIFNMLSSISWGDTSSVAAEGHNRPLIVEQALGEMVVEPEVGPDGGSPALYLLETVLGPHAGPNNLTAMLESMSMTELLSLHDELSSSSTGGVGGGSRALDSMVASAVEDSPSYFLMLEMYLLHALPYCQCALNWLFYAFLNRNLRQQSCTAKCAVGNDTSPRGTVPAMVIVTGQNSGQKRPNSGMELANPNPPPQQQPRSGGLLSPPPREPFISVHYSVDGKSSSPPFNSNTTSCFDVNDQGSRLISRRRDGVCEIDWL